MTLLLLFLLLMIKTLKEYELGFKQISMVVGLLSFYKECRCSSIFGMADWEGALEVF